MVSHLDLAHHHVGGDLYCTGCRDVGCLNAYLCTQNLPAALTVEDCIFVARTLALALKDMSIEERMPLVLGGGIVRVGILPSSQSWMISCPTRQY